MGGEYEGIVYEILPSVYEPAEDTFLLAKHAKILKGRVLEIGCGSGLASLVNARHNPPNIVVGVDLNPSAVECSKRNAKLNGVKNAKFFKGDMFEPISPSEKFDAILFNPPYLPTTKKEKLKGPENLAYDGGSRGRRTLDRFLKSFGNYLKTGGVLLLVQSSLNNPGKTEEFLRQKGFRTEILETEPFFFEKLFIIRAVRVL
jgi:release factor glutamine methyltransferase